MPDHFQDIYASKAAQYDAMVAREDYQGNILKALEGIRPLTGLEVVEFGAGTGRLTRLLVTINWRFTTGDARIRLARLYPTLESDATVTSNSYLD